MAALTPRTYAAPDDETAFRIADGILGSNLNHPYNDDAAFVVKQPEYSKEVQDAIEESRADLQSKRFESYRTRRCEQTPWFWDFLNGVRPAWNPVESLLLDVQNAVIDREELARRVRQDALRLVTIDLVDFVREDQIRRLKAYSDAIAAAQKWNRPTVKQQPESADAAAAQIREALDRLTAPLLIWQEEIEAVYNAVHLVRIEKGMEVLRIGEISGTSASMVFETTIARLVGYWESCEAVSAKSAKGAPYTHFEPAVQLFVNGCLKSLPNPNDLYAAVENEYVTTLARLSLIQPGKKTPPHNLVEPIAPAISSPTVTPQEDGKPVGDDAGGMALVPLPAEFQRLREFAHFLSQDGGEGKVFTLLLERLAAAAKSNGLPLRANVADVKSLIDLEGDWKFNTSGEWQGLQTRLNKKLKVDSINWVVSSRGGAHLRRAAPKPIHEPLPQQKSLAKRARTSR